MRAKLQRAKPAFARARVLLWMIECEHTRKNALIECEFALKKRHDIRNIHLHIRIVPYDRSLHVDYKYSLIHMIEEMECRNGMHLYMLASKKWNAMDARKRLYSSHIHVCELVCTLHSYMVSIAVENIDCMLIVLIAVD